MNTFERINSELATCYSNFIRTGIFEFPHWMDWGKDKPFAYSLPMGTISSLFRQTARELKRPYIRLIRSVSSSVVKDASRPDFNTWLRRKGPYELYVPRLKKCSYLNMPLQLIAEPVSYFTSYYDHDKPRAPVEMMFDTRKYVYKFNQGDEFYHETINNILAMPEARKALAIPDEVTLKAPHLPS